MVVIMALLLVTIVTLLVVTRSLVVVLVIALLMVLITLLVLVVVLSLRVDLDAAVLGWRATSRLRLAGLGLTNNWSQ